MPTGLVDLVRFFLLVPKRITSQDPAHKKAPSVNRNGRCLVRGSQQALVKLSEVSVLAVQVKTSLATLLGIIPGVAMLDVHQLHDT